MMKNLQPMRPSTGGGGGGFKSFEQHWLESTFMNQGQPSEMFTPMPLAAEFPGLAGMKMPTPSQFMGSSGVPKIPYGMPKRQRQGDSKRMREAWWLASRQAFWAWLEEQWYLLEPAQSEGYEFGPEWTNECSTTPSPLTPARKLGIVPGSPGINAVTCGVSTINTANRAYGDEIPAGVTYVQLVASSVPWPNRNGAPYQNWRRTTPTPAVEFGTAHGPWSQPLPGSDPQNVPDPGDSGEDLPNVWSHAGPLYRTPATVVILTPDGVFKGPDTTHREVPTTEKKVKGPEWISKSFNTATEIGDFFGALAEALPDDRCKNLGIYDTAVCVLENWKDIDPVEAVKELVKNEVEDQLIGRGLGALQNAGHKLGGGGLTGFELQRMIDTALGASFDSGAAFAEKTPTRPKLPQRKMSNV